MESNRKNTVATTKNVYDNFFEEKCECDLLIPDYYPSVDKIIQCSAIPVVKEKRMDGERLILIGECRFNIVYKGDEGEIKSVSESVVFEESLAIKEQVSNPIIQVLLRSSGTSCRLINSRKIAVRNCISVAVKLKAMQLIEIIEEIETENVEALFTEKKVYSVLEQAADTTKIQGEIESRGEIQDILKVDGSVCIKDVKVLAGKAIIKGILNLFVLFTTVEDPCRVESTSTAIPFTQVMEVQYQGDNGSLDVSAYIHNIRVDVENDEEGKDRLISIVTSVLTEGVLYENISRRLLVDVYSNMHPLDSQIDRVTLDEIIEKTELTETLLHEIDMDSSDSEVIQIIINPIVKKVTGKDHSIAIEGILDLAIFMRDGDMYRSVDKSLGFTINKELSIVTGSMRCEVKPDVLGIEWVNSDKVLKVKTDIAADLTVYSKETYEYISDFYLDTDRVTTDNQCQPLVIYYGEKGERLWDIARKYASSVKKIKAINNLNCDILDDKKMLLIS